MPADSGVFWVVAADLNGDSCIDLATANTYANTVSTLFNNCDGTFTHGADYQVGLLPRSIFASDFNRDGFIDLVTANSGSQDVAVLLNNGDGTFPPVPDGSYSSSGSSWGVFCSDYDGDGDIDIAVTTSDSGRVAVLMNNGDGTFPSVPALYSADGPAVGIFAADLNLDHDIDLAITSGQQNSVKTFINNGDGTFPVVPSGSYGSSGSSWAIFGADLDGDSCVDLAVTNPDSQTVAVLFNSGDGTFLPVADGSYGSSGSSWGVFCSDFDGDADIDIAVSNSDSGTICIFLNQGDSVFIPSPLDVFHSNGMAWGICAADFDGDGDIDIAVANTELNGVTLLWNSIIYYYYYYILGDANMANGSWPPAVIGSDVTYLVNYLRGLTTNPACLINGFYMAADVNGSCTIIGSDVTRLVNYFRGSGAIEYCPDWEPIWPAPADCPLEAPDGWPNCEQTAASSKSDNNSNISK